MEDGDSDSLFDSFVEAQEPSSPFPCNIRESGNELAITLELPGVSSRDLTIVVDGQWIIVEGVKGKAPGEALEHCNQRYFGTFSRSFPCPERALASRAQARLEDGVLTVLVPVVK